MHPALAALLQQRTSVITETWRSFWDQLDSGTVERDEIVMLLTSLATRLPEHDSLVSLLASLDERRDPVTQRWPDAVNIVGTGGGPGTFNISTAAAFVAAALGVPVVKTGSRAYTSKLGSVDLLERLGIGLTASYDQTGDTLDRYGIAFAGGFVYPTALTRLARRVMPLSMRPFGRFLNALGPFLAALPVGAQVTGASRHAPVDDLRRLATTVTDRTFWLCTNDLGADELLGFADNVIHTNADPRTIRLPAGRFTGPGGSLADLHAVEDPNDAVEHFLGVLSGSAGAVATRTVALNAASLAVASGRITDWSAAVAAAEQVITDGSARALAERMRVRSPRRLASTGPAAVRHG